MDDDPEAPPPPGPTWDVPTPYGSSEAVQTMGGIAAPVLAGFSFTLLALILQIEDALKWPDLALVALMGAGLGFIAVVQFTFWTRHYSARPAEILEWWPDAEDPWRRELIREDQWTYEAERRRWATAARRAYITAIVLLLVGVALVLVPDGPLGDIPAGRATAIAVALLGLLLELLWIGSSWVLTTERARVLRRSSLITRAARVLGPRETAVQPPREQGPRANAD